MKKISVVCFLLDCVVIGLFFLLGVSSEESFLKDEVLEYDPLMSLFDLVVLIFLKGIVILVLYVAVGVKNLIPITVLAFISSILALGKVALFVLVPGESPKPSNYYIVPFYVFIMGWAELSLLIWRRTNEREKRIYKQILKQETQKNNSFFSDPIPPSFANIGVNRRASFKYVPVKDDNEEPSIPIYIKQEKDMIIPEIQAVSVPISLNSSYESNRPPMPSIRRLIKIMANPIRGIEVADRVQMFITYKNCFVGKEAVTWVIETLKQHNLSRKYAIQILQEAMDEGFIQEVQHDYDKFYDDNNYFYTFWEGVVPLDETKIQIVKTRMEMIPITLSKILQSLRKDIKCVTRKITDRNGKENLYPECFKSSDAMKWIINNSPNHSFGTDDSILFFQNALDLQLIYCINDNRKEFLDGEYYYRFSEDDDQLPIYLQRHPISQFDYENADYEEILQLIDFFHVEEASTASSDSDDLRRSLIEKIDNPEPTREFIPQGGKSPISKPLMNFLSNMNDPTTGIKMKKIIYRGEQRNCFNGTQAVNWMMENKNLPERSLSVKILEKLVKQGIIIPLDKSDTLVDSYDALYEFIELPNSFESIKKERTKKHFISTKNSSGNKKLPSSLLNFLNVMKKEGSGVEIKTGKRKDRNGNTMFFERVFQGDEAVDWILGHLSITDRQQGIKIMQKLMNSEAFINVDGQEEFEDSPEAFYKYTRSSVRT